MPGDVVRSIFSSGKGSPSPPVPREPQRDVFFLKTHKTASSSVFNLLMRRADGEGLNLAIPRNTTRHMMGYPEIFSPHKHMVNYSQCGLRPNLMALHMRYNGTGVKEASALRMAPNWPFIGSKRNGNAVFM
ncbi:hypothetical protein HPB50_011031 [Hyalomma asiaticum]|uniref:Uncharacterized protein n=1 Tax=Hyalomma asiaticum TaxID=266040 RepID=A0ACB7RJC5_HYAAI|nr:hypothetical protein HPB50_011031 [Hyalomma asiaticum]